MKKQFIFDLALFSMVLTSCEEVPIIPVWKSDGGAKPISITSFYPVSGVSGTVVTIVVENFSPGTCETFVTFDNINADVLQVQSGKITVLTPLNVVQGDHEIAVSAMNQTVTSSTTFHVTESRKDS